MPNKTAALSSAQVLHNKLTRRGAWELILFKDGDRTILAQTFFVQDIEAYAARDQARPARDARVGMLPPKLAQIIINLAMRAPERRDKPERLDRYLVLDPFCGTGVILQEALLMGYSAVGTDNSDKMVEYTKANMKWLYQNHPGIVGYTNVELGDATDHKWQIFSAMASETYLGRPLTKLPSPPELNKIVSDVNTILTKFLANLAKQNKEQRRICLAIPAWQIGPNKFKTLPVLDKLTDMGYNVLKFKHVGAQDLFYFRENQIVARQLIVLGRDLKEITR